MEKRRTRVQKMETDGAMWIILTFGVAIFVVSVLMLSGALGLVPGRILIGIGLMIIAFSAAYVSMYDITHTYCQSLPHIDGKVVAAGNAFVVSNGKVFRFFSYNGVEAVKLGEPIFRRELYNIWQVKFRTVLVAGEEESREMRLPCES